MPIRITLGAKSGERALREANVAAVPVELWTRLAIEADRQLARAAALARVERPRLSTRLDEFAADDEQPVIGLTTRGLSGYARLLRTSQPSELKLRRSRSVRLTLLVPDTLALAWTRAANAGGKNLSAWAETRVLAAPASVVRWEATAAAAGDSLGEWILAVALAARS
jgi:hypothetical protein